ncbi:glycosyltransferase family 2 protein [Candidatus Woesearchaeota archaeon]|nr:glycosyltransferase family 2 protein [Candidatus Woesearchaeota archaeon]MBU3942174.1 glycosyltransferase family 2 protein [Nanoarchaeota archaeon]
MDLVNLVLPVIYMITLFYTIFWLITFLDSKEEKKKVIKKFPLVSVVVPAYNEEDVILETLESVIGLDYPKNKLDIIIVNDGSTDSTKDVAEKFIDKHKGYDIKLINQANQGKWVALNNALKIAKGEFFTCLDADSSVEKAALKKMLPYFTDNNVAAVLPLIKIKNPKGILQKIQCYEYIVNFFYKKIMSSLNCIHVTPGPFGVYRKDIINKIGGFRQGHNTEDMEIAFRLQKHQYKIIQLLNVNVYTYAPSSLKNFYFQRNRWNKGSILNVWDYRKMIFRKEYGDFGILQMPMVLCAGFIAMTIIILVLFYNVFKPMFNSLHNLSLVDFDIFSFIANLNLNLNLLDFNYYKLIIIVVMITLSLTVFTLAHKYTKQRLTSQGITPLLVFILFYYLLLGVIWLGITKDLIFKKAKKW